MFESGAAEHSGSDHIASVASENGGRIHGDDPSALTSTDLFTDDSDEDRALLDWLRERTEHPRCAALLQQIMEWSGELQKAERRSWAKAQKITVKRQAKDSIRQFREAVRQHFKAAVAQEKGRVACFQFSASRGAS